MTEGEEIILVTKKWEGNQTVVTEKKLTRQRVNDILVAAGRRKFGYDE